MRIAIVGAGAIGASVAAELDGHDLVLCTRAPLPALTVETARGPRAPVFANALEPAQAAAADWVLLCTKAHQTAGAGAWLAALARPPAVLAVLQNGVEHRERVAPWAGEVPVLPVVVDCPALREGPGRVRQRRPGSMLVPDGDEGRRFAALFAGSGIAVRTTGDFTTEVWRKLCVNVTNAVLALTAQPAAVLSRPDLAELARGLALETVAVARAEGARLDPALADEIIAGYQRGDPRATPSILQDVLARRPLEHDARNGAVVRIGRRHGIATPLNSAVTALLAGLSAGFER